MQLWAFEKYMVENGAVRFYVFILQRTIMRCNWRGRLCLTNRKSGFFGLARNGYENLWFCKSFFLCDRFANIERLESFPIFFCPFLKISEVFFVEAIWEEEKGSKRILKLWFFFVCTLLSALCRIFDRRKRTVLDY